MAKNRTSNEIAAGFADEVFFGLRRQRNVLGFVAAGSITVAMTSVVALCLALLGLIRCPECCDLPWCHASCLSLAALDVLA